MGSLFMIISGNLECVREYVSRWINLVRFWKFFFCCFSFLSEIVGKGIEGEGKGEYSGSLRR